MCPPRAEEVLGGQLRVLLVGAAELIKLRYSPGRTNRCLPDGEAASLLAELPVLWPGLQIRSGKLDYTPLNLVPSWAAGKTKQEKLRHRFGQDRAVGESEALVFAQDGGSRFDPRKQLGQTWSSRPGAEPGACLSPPAFLLESLQTELELGAAAVGKVELGSLNREPEWAWGGTSCCGKSLEPWAALSPPPQQVFHPTSHAFNNTWRDFFPPRSGTECELGLCQVSPV